MPASVWYLLRSSKRPRERHRERHETHDLDLPPKPGCQWEKNVAILVVTVTGWGVDPTYDKQTNQEQTRNVGAFSLPSTNAPRATPPIFPYFSWITLPKPANSQVKGTIHQPFSTNPSKLFFSPRYVQHRVSPSAKHSEHPHHTVQRLAQGYPP